MKKFFVIGGGFLQVEFIRTVKEKGFEAHVFDNNPNCPGRSYADFFYEISISDKESILAIAKRENPIAIQTVATELGNITACYVGEHIGVKTNSFDVSLDTTDKSRMKKVFNRNNIPSAKSITIKNKLLLNEIEGLKYPLVVKASDRSAGRGVILVENREELKTAYEKALKESSNKIVLIEEFLQGDQYSVETVTSNGVHYIVGVTQESVVGAPNFVESSHILPADLSNDTYFKLESLIKYILNCFGVKFGASHIELKLKHGCFYIIEIASRMGGWRDELIKIAYDIDYLSLIIDSVTNQPINIAPRKHSYAILKLLLNQKDYERYLYLKNKYPTSIVKENISYKNDSSFEAENLIESQGSYLIETNDKDLAKAFFNRY